VNETLKKLFLFLSKDQSTPICHMPAAGEKRRFDENGVLRSKDVASVVHVSSVMQLVQ
jgi:hypothetical protein